MALINYVTSILQLLKTVYKGQERRWLIYTSSVFVERVLLRLGTTSYALQGSTALLPLWRKAHLRFLPHPKEITALSQDQTYDYTYKGQAYKAYTLRYPRRFCIKPTWDYYQRAFWLWYYQWQISDVLSMSRHWCLSYIVHPYASLFMIWYILKESSNGDWLVGTVVLLHSDDSPPGLQIVVA